MCFYVVCMYHFWVTGKYKTFFSRSFLGNESTWLYYINVAKFKREDLLTHYSVNACNLYPFHVYWTVNCSPLDHVQMNLKKNPISATVCKLLSGRLSCCEGENKRKLAPAYQMLLFQARVSTADLDVHEFPLGKKKKEMGKKKNIACVKFSRHKCRKL